MTAQQMRQMHSGKAGLSIENVYERLEQMANKVDGNSVVMEIPLQSGVKEKLILNGFKVTENEKGQAVIDWSE